MGDWVDLSVAAVACVNSAKAGGVDVCVGPCPGQVQPGLENSGFVVLAQLVQTLHKAVQAPDVVRVLGRANQCAVQSQIGPVDRFGFFHPALLQQKGAEISYHDPHAPEVQIGGQSYKSVDLDDDVLTGCDIAVIVTNHSAIDWERVVAKAPRIFDTRNATAGVREGRERIRKL